MIFKLTMNLSKSEFILLILLIGTWEECSQISGTKKGCASEDVVPRSIMPDCNIEEESCECYYDCECEQGYYPQGYIFSRTEKSSHLGSWDLVKYHVSVCDPCNIPNCSKCHFLYSTPNKFTTCDECSPSYLLSIESSAWGNPMECIPCPSKCVNCLPTERKCKCMEGANTDYSEPCTSCLDSVENKCSACDPAEHGLCTECISGFEYMLGTHTCEEVHCADYNCLTCDNQECSKCKIGYILDPYTLQCIRCSVYLDIKYCGECSPTLCTRCLPNKILLRDNDVTLCGGCPPGCSCDGTSADPLCVEVVEEEFESVQLYLERESTENEGGNPHMTLRNILLLCLGIVLFTLLIFTIIILIIRCKRNSAPVSDRSWIVAVRNNEFGEGGKALNYTARELVPSCPICLEAITQPTLGVLSCGHSGFHISCLEQWIKLHHTCPLCRANVHS